MVSAVWNVTGVSSSFSSILKVERGQGVELLGGRDARDFTFLCRARVRHLFFVTKAGCSTTVKNLRRGSALFMGLPREAIGRTVMDQNVNVLKVWALRWARIVALFVFRDCPRR